MAGWTSPDTEWNIWKGSLEATNKFTGGNVTRGTNPGHVHTDVELTEIPVFNNTGSTLTKGAPVYVNSWNIGQDALQVELADADDVSKMPAIGLIAGDISNGDKGAIVITGELKTVNTNAWNIGDELWVDTTAGQLTSTKPTALNAAVQKVAQVARKGTINGVLIIFGAGRNNDVPNQLGRDLDAGANNMVNLGITSGANTIFTSGSMTGDNIHSGAAYIPNIIFSGAGSAGTASNYPMGTIFIGYTP